MSGDVQIEHARRWMASGCRRLTGRHDRPGLGPPVGFVTAVDRIAERIASASTALGGRVEFDPLDEIGVRARLVGLRRRGATGCGGASRLLRAAEGWAAITLARPSDVEMVPALVEREVALEPDRPDDAAAWTAIREWSARQASDELISRTRLLGLAAAVVTPTPDSARAATETVDVCRHPRPDGAAARCGDPPRVVDLSSLWAGPLCSRILGLACADVVKVESTSRPDGARRGSRAMWTHLHAGQRSVALDLTTAGDRSRLAALLAAADVVIEGSRPRAMASWGLSPDDVTGPAVWLSITGYGYRGPGSDRVGFGDDVAAGAGLIAGDRDGEGPWFCADAVADPLTGIVAAALVLEALVEGERVHLDVAMHDVARRFAGRCVGGATAVDVTDARLADSDVARWWERSDVEGGLDDVLPLGAHTNDVMHDWCP